MQVMDAIRSRRSIRKYLDRPVEDDKLALVAEAFRLAPSAGNGQNWKLIIVKDPETKKKVNKATLSQPAFVEEAPVMLVACGLSQGVMSNAHRVDSIDVSIAMTHCMLEAFELGLGTCWMASYREDWMRSALDLPDDVSVVAITPLGYPAEDPAAKPRKAADVVIEYR